MQLLLELGVAGALAGVKLGIPALGFALLFYTTRELHFAFGAISVCAGYIFYGIVAKLGMTVLTVPLAVALGILVPVLASIAIHRHVYLRLNSVLPVVMAALGLGLVIENALQIVAGPGVQIISVRWLNQILDFGVVRVRLVDLCVLALFTAIALGIDLFMNRTKLGQGLKATMDDPEMADLVGIRTPRMRIGAYAVGSGLGALAGIIMVVDTGSKPANGFLILLFALIITIMGRNDLRSVILWSVLFGIVRGLWSWQFSTEYQELAMFVLMISYLIGREVWERRSDLKSARRRLRMRGVAA